MKASNDYILEKAGNNRHLIFQVSHFIFTELDDGAYNPLWTTKGFTQTFHFWKESRRAQSVPLNAYLTYVTLPWFTIITGKCLFVRVQVFIQIFLLYKGSVMLSVIFR